MGLFPTTMYKASDMNKIRVVGAVGIEPTNLNVSPDDSIDLASPNPEKEPVKRSILDRDWTEPSEVNPFGGTNFEGTCFSVSAVQCLPFEDARHCFEKLLS